MLTADVPGSLEGKYMELKDKIRMAYVRSGISVTAIGKEIGMSQSVISQRLTTGKFTQLKLKRMASVLGCKHHSVFEYKAGTRIE